jgi:hypothetical protein
MAHTFCDVIGTDELIGLVGAAAPAARVPEDALA